MALRSLGMWLKVKRRLVGCVSKLKSSKPIAQSSAWQRRPRTPLTLQQSAARLPVRFTRSSEAGR